MTSVAVLTCVYRRPERLTYTLSMLDAQTYAGFDVWIVNNNAEQRGYVDRVAAEQLPDATVLQMPDNQGAFVRNELTHRLRNDYQWFIWLDDDIDFDEHMVARLMAKADPHTLWGMDGFRFGGRDYWRKHAVPEGETCDFLYVACCCIPSGVADAPGFAEPIAEEYRRLDGMHLCYHAAMQGYEMRVHNPGVRMVVDGKDTYREEHDRKVALLDEFRRRGWNV